MPAHQVLKSLGYPDIPVLVTPNPVMYLTEPEIQDRVNSLIGKVAASLCNPDHKKQLLG